MFLKKENKQKITRMNRLFEGAIIIRCLVSGIKLMFCKQHGRLLQKSGIENKH